MDKMTKPQIEQMAYELLELHGLRPAWRFRWNKRKNAVGLCNYITRTIELSTVYATKVPMADVKNTILHEIAHALSPRHAGHGPIWQRKAREIGAKPVRCADGEAFVAAHQEAAKYLIKCSNCGNTSSASRKGSNLRMMANHPERFRCAKCNKVGTIRVTQQY